MSTNSFLPAGRTSRIKKGEVYLQLQTEYAARPYPRITTTIINDGRVVHKVEKKLSQPVDCYEEQQRIEAAMRHLHSEITSVVKENPFNGERGVGGAKSSSAPLGIPEKLAAVKGVRRVLELDQDGQFTQSEPSEAFRGLYKDLLKSLADLIQIFDTLPGENGNRQKGVYEVERNRLYFLSSGTFFYFVLCEPKDEPVEFEKVFKAIITASASPLASS